MDHQLTKVVKKRGNFTLFSSNKYSFYLWTFSKRSMKEINSKRLEECNDISTTMIVFTSLQNFMSLCVLLVFWNACVGKNQFCQIILTTHGFKCCWYMIKLFKERKLTPAVGAFRSSSTFPSISFTLINEEI